MGDSVVHVQELPTPRPRGCKPFLRWVGGKAKLLPTLLALLPPDVDERRHVEPFVGGGSMFFARGHDALLCDVNPELINTYEHVRANPNKVMVELMDHVLSHSPHHYTYSRDLFNTKRLAGLAAQAALFIYLNKTCFNGLYRVNRKGEFNVPIGAFAKQPNICDEPTLRSASAALQPATLKAQTFEQTLSECGPRDFIYLDPPYLPLSETADFVSYAEGGFDEDAHEMLAIMLRRADKRGAKFMLSNADVPVARALYRHYRIVEVMGKRSVAAAGASRQSAKEIVVLNY